MNLQRPSWDMYQTLLAVLRTGSLSAAARELAISQPTARRHVEALEQALGAVLFTRSATGLLPTEAARAALPLAEEMQAGARALERSLSAQAGPVTGRVRLSASLVMSHEVLPPILAALTVRHPGLSVELSATNAVENLRRRDADIALRVTPPLQDGLVARKLGEVGLGLFASPAYAQTRDLPQVPDDLPAHPLIGEDRGRGFETALAAAGIDTGRLRFALCCDNDAVQLEMLRAGAGIGVCQVPLAARYGLVRVLPGFRAALPVWLVMHQDLRGVPRVRAVFDHLVDGVAAYLRAA
jgi:DNA-binding transcriptional LysR family regulator